jgi:hypothetical protein
MLRLDPDALRAPSNLIARSGRVHLMDEHGRGLAGFYDVILNQHLDGYVAIREEVRRLFPYSNGEDERDLFQAPEAAQ